MDDLLDLEESERIKCKIHDQIDLEDEQVILARDSLFITGNSIDDENNENLNDDDNDIIAKASEAVHARNTRRDYRRMWKQFLAFVEERYKQDGIDILNTCTSNRIPIWICIWIYEACDEDFFNQNPSSTKTPSFTSSNNIDSHMPSTVMKNPTIDSSSPTKNPKRKKPLQFGTGNSMRSAISYGFGTIMNRGIGLWQQLDTGKYSGNPSLSSTVTTYLRSLKRKKVALGEVSVSVRSITHENIRDLWNYNQLVKSKTKQSSALTKNKQITIGVEDFSWGGPVERIMMHAIYVLAFICLLRFDEVLQIQAHHVEVVDEKEGIILLHLPFRKTHQTGEIKPFGLRLNRLRPWLCPIDALLRWAYISPYVTEGYIFRRITSNDQVSTVNKALGSDIFLEAFQHNLLDIGIDFRTFGTHSFRRGGCQYFASVLRWEIRKLCDWGGWSMNFENLTIVRYLLGWNDDPVHRREDFLDPTIKGDYCKACGRSCDCA